MYQHQRASILKEQNYTKRMRCIDKPQNGRVRHCDWLSSTLVPTHLQILSKFNVFTSLLALPGGRAVSGVGLRPLACWHSNPARGAMYVSVLSVVCVCVLSGRSLVQRKSCRLSCVFVSSRNLVNEATLAHVGSQRHITNKNLSYKIMLIISRTFKARTTTVLQSKRLPFRYYSQRQATQNCLRTSDCTFTCLCFLFRFYCLCSDPLTWQFAICI